MQGKSWTAGCILLGAEPSRNPIHIRLRSMFLLPASWLTPDPRDQRVVQRDTCNSLEPLRPCGSQSSAHSSSPGESGRSADPSPGDGVCPVFQRDPHRGGGQACGKVRSVTSEGTMATTFLTPAARSMGNVQHATFCNRDVDQARGCQNYPLITRGKKFILERAVYPFDCIR